MSNPDRQCRAQLLAQDLLYPGDRLVDRLLGVELLPGAKRSKGAATGRLTLPPADLAAGQLRGDPFRASIPPVVNSAASMSFYWGAMRA